MQSPLDGQRSWFLQSIVLRENLCLRLAEGITSAHDEHVIGEIWAKPIEITEDSRVFLITFERPLAWQVLDESYTAWDDYEIGDQGPIRTLTRSRYMDFLVTSDPLMKEQVEKASHYRICTEDDVIDVVTPYLPAIELLHRDSE